MTLDFGGRIFIPHNGQITSFLKIFRCSKITIRDVTFKGFNTLEEGIFHGIEVSQSTEITLEKIQLDNIGIDGVTIADSSRAEFNNLTIRGSGNNGISVTDNVDGLDILNCHIVGTKKGLHPMQKAGFGIDIEANNIQNAGAKNIMIKHCNIIGNYSAGININKTGSPSNIKIDNCRILYNDLGVHFEGGIGVSINDNSITSCTIANNNSCGILSSLDNTCLSINDCKVGSNGQDNIKIVANTGKKITIEKNFISEAGQNNISLDNNLLTLVQVNFNIKDNFIKDARIGIEISALQDVNLDKNIFSSCLFAINLRNKNGLLSRDIKLLDNLFDLNNVSIFGEVDSQNSLFLNNSMTTTGGELKLKDQMLQSLIISFVTV